MFVIRELHELKRNGTWDHLESSKTQCRSYSQFCQGAVDQVILVY